MSTSNLFQSARLLYRGRNNTDEEKTFMRDLMLSGSDTYAQVTSRLLSPPRLAEVDRDNTAPNDTMLCVMIYLLPEGDNEPTMIGSLSVDCNHTVRHHRSLHLGIMIAPKFQRKGYGTEAIKWALDWGFEMAGAHSIRLTAFSFNEGAVRLYERIGFVNEGVRRESLLFRGKWHDHVLFGLLEGEWAALKGKNDEGGL
ncbi:hypothetical protein OQA88_8689 [Cercophora sp. LCS_1]